MNTISLNTRYYRAIPIDATGYEEETLELDPERTAVVIMHCWNIGCPDGPPVDTQFCVGMGWPQATEEAWRIMKDIIRPVLDVVRTTDLHVCHVEADWMASAYPEIESRRRPDTSQPNENWQKLIDRAHGPRYLEDSPLAQMRRAEIVAPDADEPLFFYTEPLDEYFRERGIDTAIYAGFATNMCILNAAGGAQPMAARGHRCILIRDATVGTETPESFPERLATRYGIHMFEWKLGCSTTSSDLMRALELELS